MDLERDALGREEPRVIVGVSPSLPGLAAIRFAGGQALRRSVPLLAVRVWKLDLGPRARPAVEWERALADEAHRCVERSFRAATGRSARECGASVRTPSGPVHVALQDCVLGPDDLLVVGAAAHRWFGGATARRCVRGAACPVVVVPPPVWSRRMAREIADELRRL